MKGAGVELRVKVISGTTLGVFYELENGMLFIKLEQHDTYTIINELKRLIRMRTSSDNSTTEDFDAVNRISRMCWEILESNTISSLDARDCAILYTVRQELGVEWVFRILNKVRGLLKESFTTPTMADAYAKSVSIVMES